MNSCNFHHHKNFTNNYSYGFNQQNENSTVEKTTSCAKKRKMAEEPEYPRKKRRVEKCAIQELPEEHQLIILDKLGLDPTLAYTCKKFYSMRPEKQFNRHKESLKYLEKGFKSCFPLMALALSNGNLFEVQRFRKYSNEIFRAIIEAAGPYRARRVLTTWVDCRLRSSYLLLLAENFQNRRESRVADKFYDRKDRIAQDCRDREAAIQEVTEALAIYRKEMTCRQGVSPDIPDLFLDVQRALCLLYKMDPTIAGQEAANILKHWPKLYGCRFQLLALTGTIFKIRVEQDPLKMLDMLHTYLKDKTFPRFENALGIDEMVDRFRAEVIEGVKMLDSSSEVIGKVKSLFEISPVIFNKQTQIAVLIQIGCNLVISSLPAEAIIKEALAISVDCKDCAKVIDVYCVLHEFLKQVTVNGSLGEIRGLMFQQIEALLAIDSLSYRQIMQLCQSFAHSASKLAAIDNKRAAAVFEQLIKAIKELPGLTTKQKVLLLSTFAGQDNLRLSGDILANVALLPTREVDHELSNCITKSLKLLFANNPEEAFQHLLTIIDKYQENVEDLTSFFASQYAFVDLKKAKALHPFIYSNCYKIKPYIDAAENCWKENPVKAHKFLSDALTYFDPEKVEPTVDLYFLQLIETTMAMDKEQAFSMLKQCGYRRILKKYDTPLQKGIFHERIREWASFIEKNFPERVLEYVETLPDCKLQRNFLLRCKNTLKSVSTKDLAHYVIHKICAGKTHTQAEFALLFTSCLEKGELQRVFHGFKSLVNRVATTLEKEDSVPKEEINFIKWLQPKVVGSIERKDLEQISLEKFFKDYDYLVDHIKDDKRKFQFDAISLYLALDPSKVPNLLAKFEKEYLNENTLYYSSIGSSAHDFLCLAKILSPEHISM